VGSISAQLRRPNGSWMAKLVTMSELAVGVRLILGLFTGAAAVAILGSNVMYMFSGNTGVNPVLVLVALLLNSGLAQCRSHRFRSVRTAHGGKPLPSRGPGQGSGSPSAVGGVARERVPSRPTAASRLGCTRFFVRFDALSQARCALRRRALVTKSFRVEFPPEVKHRSRALVTRFLCGQWPDGTARRLRVFGSAGVTEL
jgi:hypothetical protein